MHLKGERDQNQTGLFVKREVRLLQKNRNKRRLAWGWLATQCLWSGIGQLLSSLHATPWLFVMKYKVSESFSLADNVSHTHKRQNMQLCVCVLRPWPLTLFPYRDRDTSGGCCCPFSLFSLSLFSHFSFLWGGRVSLRLLAKELFCQSVEMRLPGLIVLRSSQGSIKPLSILKRASSGVQLRAVWRVWKGNQKAFPIMGGPQQSAQPAATLTSSLTDALVLLLTCFTRANTTDSAYGPLATII